MSGRRPREMVDTMVLIYGMRTARPKDAPAVLSMMQKSKHLLRQYSPLRVSVISTLEFLRGLKPADEAAARPLLDGLMGEAVSPAAAQRASDLLSKRVYTKHACHECSNLLVGHPCKKCGKHVASVQRMNDALITATAEVLEDVDILYTFDRGILDFAGDVTNLRIMEPPSIDGPLFAKKDET